MADRQIHGLRDSRGGVEGKQARLTLQTKKKILGLNAARLYGVDVEAQKQKIRAAGGYDHLAASAQAAE